MDIQEIIKVTVKQKDFAWGVESSAATKKFFELVNEAEKIFSEKRIKEMVAFYTGDEPLNIYQLKCSVEKNQKNLDVKVAMFVEGKKGCHRVEFYLNDYEEREKGPAAKAKALSLLKYIKYMEAQPQQPQKRKAV